jgi:hypothetical protein
MSVGELDLRVELELHAPRATTAIAATTIRHDVACPPEVTHIAWLTARSN